MSQMFDKGNQQQVNLKRQIGRSDLPPPAPSKDPSTYEIKNTYGTKLATLGSGEAEFVPHDQSKTPTNLDQMSKLEFTYKSMDNIDDGPLRTFGLRQEEFEGEAEGNRAATTQHFTSEEDRAQRN